MNTLHRHQRKLNRGEREAEVGGVAAIRFRKRDSIISEMNQLKRRRSRPRCLTSTFYILGYLLSILTAAQAHCPPTDTHIAQDNFYKCVRNMDNSDKDENDVLDPEEFEIYVRAMLFSLFVVPPFSKYDPLPHEIQHDLFEELHNVSGSVIDENGNPMIDIYGSNVYELPLIDRERMNQLKEICWASVDALHEFVPKTAAPKQLVLENVKTQNDLDETNEFGDVDAFADMLSIHSSFVVANFEGLEAHDLEVTQDSLLSLAFMEFILELLKTECPTHNHYKACWEDPYASYDEALEENGSLCGSHAEWVRRIFCGTRRRDLEAGEDAIHHIENVILYKVQDTRCPIPMETQGKGGGFAPKCQIVYAHYMLHLHDLDLAHKDKIEEVYVNITQAAIVNGMLEDALLGHDPDSVYVVEGAGPKIRPNPVHKHKTFPFHRKRHLDKCHRRELIKQMLAWEAPIKEHELSSDDDENAFGMLRHVSSSQD